MKVQEVDPLNFAFVMATAIISITLHILNWQFFSGLFFLLSTVGFTVLVFLFGAMFILFPKKMFSEMVHAGILFKYFTFSAAASGLAIRFCMAGNITIAALLGITGAVSAVILTYATFNNLLFLKKTSIKSVSPYWLLMAIATNYVGINITTFWKAGIIEQPLFLVISFCFWAFAITIYLLFMGLNLFRMFFMSFEGKDINPSYWTCIGAAAIAVVDGCNLLSIPNPPMFLDIVRPFIEGMNIFLWGWASAWFPILLLMECWKYTHFKIAISYQPALWAIVFPLGMYTAATYLISLSIDLPTIQVLVPFMLWVSLIAWGIVSFLAFVKLLKYIIWKT